MWWIALCLHTSFADQALQPEDVLNKIETTRASISEDERRQREALAHLFTINKKVKDISRKQEALTQRLLSQEGNVRLVARDVVALENQVDQQKEMLNKRLRNLYQERDQGGFHWLFSAHSPVELERNHRYLRLLVDADHRQLVTYVNALRGLERKRSDLKGMVTRLAVLQKEARVQEQALATQLHEKSRLLEDLKKAKDVKLSMLKGLRRENASLGEALSYAFFERKGVLPPPVEGRIAHDFGTYLDPQFRFRLTHKGLFYSAPSATPVRAIFHGRVAFANQLPGYGKTVMIDHGDNYYSVYAFANKLKVREGSTIDEGDVIALSGEGSPLFGPGLYFEIRHFTDAIDPRPWIKDSVTKTADSH